MVSVTAAQRHKFNTDPISDAYLILLQFQEDTRSAINRAAINNEDVTHDGETFTATRINFRLPGSGSGSPTVKLEMSNLSRVIGLAINRAKNRIGCRIKMIDASDPDVALIDTSNMFILTSASGDGVAISADLGMRASLMERVPARRTSKNFLPGLWFGR